MVAIPGIPSSDIRLSVRRSLLQKGMRPPRSHLTVHWAAEVRDRKQGSKRILPMPSQSGHARRWRFELKPSPLSLRNREPPDTFK